MSKRKESRRSGRKGNFAARYKRACRLAATGRAAGEKAYRELEKIGAQPGQKALVANDLAVLAAVKGDVGAARERFRAALLLDPGCEPARLNLAFLEADYPAVDTAAAADARSTLVAPASTQIKVAVLSFLFNWPSTGGGIVHTVELCRFLGKAGFDVRHIYARYPAWGIGGVKGEPPLPSEVLAFDEGEWNVAGIQGRFRAAVDAFGPDYVIITDSWNMKPVLAEAMAGYAYILRLQAMECLCPLNNMRLLPGEEGHAGKRVLRQCPLNQLSNPGECAGCVAKNGCYSGSLHRAERALAGVGTPGYHERLLRVVRGAEAVLVVNPLTEELLRPFSDNVRVVTAGMDAARFPRPAAKAGKEEKVLLFAGLVEEPAKGFPVLQEACALLWQRRRDFELVATGEPAGSVGEFTRFVGWLYQEALPAQLAEADVVVLPAVGQEALGRTAVEAMAAGRPVVASRIGGLPATVVDGTTGLLCEPGNAADLAKKLDMLLDDPALRDRLGQAGRRRFEEEYSWDVIIERHYRPLLKPRERLAHHPRSQTPFGNALLETPFRESGHAGQTEFAGVRSQTEFGNEETRPRPVIPAYTPRLPQNVDHGRLVDDVSGFFKLERGKTAALLASYRALHEAKGYARTLGELKTLCFEEAFVLYVALALTRPKTMVEIGVQQGRSLRRLVDIKNALALDCRVLGFDTVDQVQFVGRGEAELRIEDVSGRFASDVLAAYEPGFIFHDAHPYALVKEAVTSTLAAGNWLLAIHDCGPGLCNPRMTLARDDPNITSMTGVWERHVLAEVFGVALPLSAKLDDLETPAHRWHVFGTSHGLGVLLPK